MISIKAVSLKSKGDEKVLEGRYQDAVQFYREAITIEPHYLQAWNNLGYCLVKMGKTDEAVLVRNRINEIKGQEEASFVPSAADKKVPLSRSGLFFASAWDRWFAYILDSVLLVIVFAVPAAALFRVFPHSPEVFLLLIAVFLVTYWLYFAAFEAGGHLGTLGKRALGIFVTDDNGYRLSLPLSLERSFFKILFTLTPVSLLTLINGLVIGSSAQSKGLHDYIANTLVVTKKKTDKPAFTSGTPEKSSKLLIIIILAVIVLIGMIVLGAMVAAFIFGMAGAA